MDPLSECYSSDQSTFIFLKTAKCISKLRATPHEVFLAPIHRQLELFTELFGIFVLLSRDKIMYVDKTVV